jgi:crossover junction endodeoxyribonuclease RusA
LISVPTKKIKFTLPWPPSINKYWRKGKNRMYIDRPGKEYRKKVYFDCAQYKHVFDDRDRLSVKILASPPDRRRRDIDNLLKCPIDALEKAGVFCDDEQIDELYIRRSHEETLGLLYFEITIVS